ncbi:MAG: hypothetical protein RLZZ293_1120 [Pseudomonadota bacterium]
MELLIVTGEIYVGIFNWLSLIVLLIIASLFSFLETASVAISEHKLISLAQTQLWATYALKLKRKLEQVLIFSLFGNSFFNALVSTISTMLVIKIFGDGQQLILSIATLIVTLLIIIFSEATPKIIASRDPVIVLRLIAIPLYFVFILTRPIIWLIDQIVYLLTRLLGIGNADGTSLDELRAIIADKKSPFEEQHRSILLNSLDLQQLAIKEVVIPLRNIEIINLHDNIDNLRQQLRHAQHTRIIVCEGESENIIGFIHVKDVLALIDNYQLTDLRSIIRKISFLPDFVLIIPQLNLAQTQRERIFVVVNEYGDVLGIACLEDMLEIVFGDFTTDAPHRRYLMIEEFDGQYIVDGATLVREFNEAYKLNLPLHYDALSINGLLMKYFGAIPPANCCIKVDNYCFEVLQIGDYWVERVRISQII